MDNKTPPISRQPGASAAPAHQPARKGGRLAAGLALTGVLAAVAAAVVAPSLLPSQLGLSSVNTAVCVQPPTLSPQAAEYAGLEAVWKSADFRARAIGWLSGAVQVETEVYDDLGAVGDDPRWDKFGAFHSYLAKAFPRVHAELSLTKVNTWGLVYEWAGSDPSLKPILLTAHQDVVPIDETTLDQWVHPPYSGAVEDGFIWGRGSIDDKSSLIGIMSAVESILETGFAPKRSVVLAFGFDEEVSGPEGARHIAKHLEATYGRDSFALLLDEGGGFQELFGTTIAALGTVEKGYGDVRVSVKSRGGHSSLPPESGHTSIGYLSLLIAQLEAHPHAPQLKRDSPLYSALVCAATYTKMPWVFRTLIKGSLKSDALLWVLESLAKRRPLAKALLGTTQAVNMMSGGVKANALPETASAVISHRIRVGSSGAELRQHFIDTLTPKVKALNLTLTAFGDEVLSGPGVGEVILEKAFGDWFEPAPVTRTTPDTAAWNVLVGSIKHTFESRLKDAVAEPLRSDKIIAAPALFPWNTDTKYYWSLTDQIYRFQYISLADFYSPTSLHSVNEALRATAFVNLIRAFGTLIFDVSEHSL